MHWIDWLIVAVTFVLPIYIGLTTRKYVRGVADFLAAGRVAGRYVLCVSGAEAAMGLISLVAVFEQYYQSGFAFGFWGAIASPIMIVLGLTGYCTYRFRETRAMTMGQFLEMRYSRKFRLLAGILQATSGILNYALFPAVGARFLVYFCGLPVDTTICGWVFPTYGLLMAGFLACAALLTCTGGMIAIMVTDCVQGLLSYPMYLVIVAYVIMKFSWFQDIGPALLDRPAGQSMLNPFDITELRDFNLLYVLIGIISGVVNRMGWSGNQGFGISARNAHEQKIAGVLGNWRSGFSFTMIVLLTVAGFTYLNREKFQAGDKGAVVCRTELALKAVDDVARGPAFAPIRPALTDYIRTGQVSPAMQELLDKTATIKIQEQSDRDRIKYVADKQHGEQTPAPAATLKPENRQAAREARVQTVRDAMRAVDPGASQTFGTIFGQMRIPMALRYLLPIGLLGIFCSLCIMLMISTDVSYMHSWGSILVQDIVLPMRGKPFTPKQQLALLRGAVVFVAIFSFFFSLLFGQVDYILMFFAITGAIWLGGSGPCIVGGLYWKRGTTAGAWTALITGSTLAVASILVQKFWVSDIYPWLYEKQWVDAVAIGLQRASAPFEPIIKWRMSSDKFPINSQELYGLNVLLSLGLYVVVSLLTCREPFNMDRMLHRGKYHREGHKVEWPRLTLRNIFSTLIGIDSQYTRGDKILAWSVFLWSFGWQFLFCFVVVAVWNVASPWSQDAWALWFFIQYYLVGGAVGMVSTVWFTIGGTLDLRRLFKDLVGLQTDTRDDGRVIGHVSTDDVTLVEQVDHVPVTEAPPERRSPGSPDTPV